MFSSKRRVLLISEDKAWQEALSEALAPLGEVVVAQEEERGLEHARRAISEGQPYCLIVIDLNITRNLQNLIARILAEHPGAGVIGASAAPSWRPVREALQAGAIDFINKTLNKEELLVIFRNALMKTPPAHGEEGECSNE